MINSENQPIVKECVTNLLEEHGCEIVENRMTGWVDATMQGMTIFVDFNDAIQGNPNPVIQVWVSRSSSFSPRSRHSRYVQIPLGKPSFNEEFKSTITTLVEKALCD